MIDLGWRLFKARKNAGLTQEEAAKKLHTHVKVIVKWERSAMTPSPGELLRIAKAYGTTADALLGGDTTMPLHVTRDAPKPAVKESAAQPEDDAYYTLDDNPMQEDVRRRELDEFMSDIPIIPANIADNEEIKTGGAFKMEAEVKIKIGDIEARVSKHKFMNAAYAPMITLLYFLLGAVFGWWHPGWLLFLTIPLYYTWPNMDAADPIRELRNFAYPVLVTMVYLILGCYFSWWHPTWLLFLTIPLYYSFLGNARITK
ncbi:MAG: helix-turn-helix domain-containing protein [Oscillospiraceae bacterium]|jgi:transcriptional regulator with XRE-family HTH domain|nr:helix-turn-helix domain-containing protein [Oscillospiraceae bacterium]